MDLVLNPRMHRLVRILILPLLVIGLCVAQDAEPYFPVLGDAELDAASPGTVRFVPPGRGTELQRKQITRDHRLVSFDRRLIRDRFEFDYVRESEDWTHNSLILIVDKQEGCPLGGLPSSVVQLLISVMRRERRRRGTSRRRGIPTGSRGGG